ncbi:hypothetical protein [Streptomyces sp. NPDC001315]
MERARRVDEELRRVADRRDEVFARRAAKTEALKSRGRASMPPPP